MSYDSKCYDLAEIFLEDEPHLRTEKRVDELAQLIQTTIEDYIRHENSNYEPPDPPGFEAGFCEEPLSEDRRAHAMSDIDRGPLIEGHPSYVIEDGVRYDYHRVARGVRGKPFLSQMRDDELMIAPGLIYRMAAPTSTESQP